MPFAVSLVYSTLQEPELWFWGGELVCLLLLMEYTLTTIGNLVSNDCASDKNFTKTMFYRTV
jgi:hypothetical protein